MRLAFVCWLLCLAFGQINGTPVYSPPKAPATTTAKINTTASQATSHRTAHQETKNSTSQAHQKTSHHKETHKTDPETTSNPETHRHAYKTNCWANHAKAYTLDKTTSASSVANCSSNASKGASHLMDKTSYKNHSTTHH
ncbi:hypothetical protein M5D96_008538 [Drosophila gunungcola]|uniref:Uncharacterized protein n=1 Tax=Drosophila gunungcola TaxID=103775 RepID=A0A9Q0BP16_9MUSC|nr:hypothetical protein M5D96_008538 [Drosophila gunungcola]